MQFSVWTGVECPVQNRNKQMHRYKYKKDFRDEKEDLHRRLQGYLQTDFQIVVDKAMNALLQQLHDCQTNKETALDYSHRKLMQKTGRYKQIQGVKYKQGNHCRQTKKLKYPFLCQPQT